MSKYLSTTGLVFLAVLLLVINLFAGIFFKSSRLDLTDNQLYTLSPGTENILSELQEPITLRLYFSEKYFTGIPAITTYGQRVKDLLDEYVSLSKGNLKLIIADPEPFSDTEDQAVQYGLQGVPIDASGSQAYFGLVGSNSTDDEEVIAFLQPDKEESLEYDITRMVYQLSNPKRGIVGIISGLPMATGASNPMVAPGSSQDWFMLTQLKENYDVRTLETSIEKIPEDIDVLMLIHPKSLTDNALFAIDQYVLSGGRLLAFIDPFSEADQPMTDPTNPMAAMQQSRSSELSKLLSAWGIEFASDKVVGDRLNAQRVQAQSGGRVQAVDYVAWLSLNNDNFSADDFVARDLQQIGMATTGFFSKKADSNIDFVPLIETSAEAMAYNSMQFQFGANPAALLRSYQSGGQKLTLAARISGELDSAFPEGLESATAIENPLAKSVDRANIIVVADTDMLEDKHWVTLQNFFGNRIAVPRANNDVFVMNAIENLSGSNDLISLRSRSKSARPFTKVAALKQAAEQRFRDKEKALQSELQQTENKLAELQRNRDGVSNMILSAEQKQEILKFREQQVETRKELRNVQHELIKSVESLGTTLKVLNIILLPLLVILAAILVSVIRARRLKHAVS